MKNIFEIMKDNGIEIPEDKQSVIEKAVAENYKTIAEFDKKIAKIEGERDDYKTRFETADGAIKKFEGVDIDDLNKQIADYKKQAEDAETNFNNQLYERDFADALNGAMGAYKFTSNAAKESIMTKVKGAGLKLVDGKIMGLSDFMDTIKAKDADAFTTEDEKQKARFTNPLSNSINGETDPDPDSLDARIAKYRNMQKGNK